MGILARVLVVEDSPVVRRLIEMTLRGMADVETCANGTEGLQRVLEERPDALVIDIGLPGMSGWQVIEALRADPRTIDLPVLVLTAHAKLDLRERLATARAASVSKPFNPSDLRQAVEGLLRPAA